MNTDDGFVITGAENIARFRLITLRSAIKLEKLGMRRHGRSATTIARGELKTPKATRDELIAHLTELIDG